MSARLSFVAPPPGFAPHTAFTLAPVDGAEGLFTMRADADAALRVYLVDPGVVAGGYAPTLRDDQVGPIDLADPGDAMLLVVAHPAEGGVSVNLMAPVVVNRRTGAASQVILDDQGYPLRAPLG